MLLQTVLDVSRPTKLVLEQPPRYFEGAIIVGLFFLLFVVVAVVSHIYRNATIEHRESSEKLHNRHLEERKEWNRENKHTVERVERVVTELIGTIRATNIHIQQNADGSVGSQAATSNHKPSHNTAKVS